MKRKIYTPLLLTALFMSTLSQTVPGTTANAAKKPALSKTKVSVYTGKKAKVSIKKSVNLPAASQFLLQKKLHHKKMRLSHPVRLRLRRRLIVLPL